VLVSIFLASEVFVSNKSLDAKLQLLKLEWQEIPTGTRQIDGINLVWFGELERKLAKLSKNTFTYRSSC
jgi:hypothetical protein